MKFIKKINNNVAFAEDDHGQEYIILGKGIGFDPVASDIIDSQSIDRIFKAEVNDQGSCSLDVLINVSHEVIEATTKVSCLWQDRST